MSVGFPRTEPFLLVISGPSGAGKSSVVRELLRATPDLAFSVSTTTRPPRDAEREGVDYHFVTEERFEELVAEDAFVEHARVHDHRYGTQRKHLEAELAAGRIPLLDIDVQGGLRVLSAYRERVVSVFLFPPTWEELERRLRGRGSEDEATVRRRLANARREVGVAPRYGYYVINDRVEEVTRRLAAIVEAERWRRVRWPRPPLEAAAPEG